MQRYIVGCQGASQQGVHSWGSHQGKLHKGNETLVIDHLIYCQKGPLACQYSLLLKHGILKKLVTYRQSSVKNKNIQ